MRVLSLREILSLYQSLMESSGGMTGVRDWNALLSSIATPHATFGGRDLYPSVIDKSAILCFGLVLNHPFHDGNKRIGHAAMETTLLLYGFELISSVDEQERVILDLAAGKLTQLDFSKWVKQAVGV
jgi:death on curing protein